MYRHADLLDIPLSDPHSYASFHPCLFPMRLKARGLAQHGGRTACLFRTLQVALTGAAQLSVGGFPAAVI